MRYLLLLILVVYNCAPVPSRTKNPQHLKPPQGYIKSFQSADTIAVEINQYLEDRRSIPITGSICEIINTYVGIMCIATEDTTYDYTIKGTIYGKLLYAVYGGGREATGAQISGSFTFRTKGHQPHIHRFSKTNYPPSQINLFDSDWRINFRKTIRESDLYKQVFLFINEIYGITPLILAVDDKYNHISWGAIYALGTIRNVEAVPAIINSLKSNGAQIRKASAYSLGEIQDKRAFEPLVMVINKDKDSGVSIAAVNAIKKIDPSRAVDILLVTISMSRRSQRIRSAAIKALGEIGDVRVIEPLIKMLDDKNIYIKRDSYNTLRKITNYKATDSRDKEEWLKWWNNNKGQYSNT